MSIIPEIKIAPYRVKNYGEIKPKNWIAHFNLTPDCESSDLIIGCEVKFHGHGSKVGVHFMADLSRKEVEYLVDYLQNFLKHHERLQQ